MNIHGGVPECSGRIVVEQSVLPYLPSVGVNQFGYRAVQQGDRCTCLVVISNPMNSLLELDILNHQYKYEY